MFQVPGDIKTGLRILVDDIPFEIIEYENKKVGKGVAICKAKGRNLISGAIVEKSLNSGKKFLEVETQWKLGSYSYYDEETKQYMFMDGETFETMGIAKDVMGELGEYLDESSAVDIEFYNGKIIRIQLKNEIVRVVVSINQLKENGKDCTCVLDNGVTKSGPPYLVVGDKVLIDGRDFRIVKRL